jgi:hypothetical protein
LPPRPGVAALSRTEQLTERAITFAIAESDEDLTVAHLAFLAHRGHPALDVNPRSPAWPAATESA